MTARLEPLLEAFSRACLDVFGAERVEGIVIHGSAVKGGGIPGYSDVDFMVFVTPDCFDGDGQLPDGAAFALQERIGPLPWREAGYGYPQANFYDARRLPSWWTGPAPGAYRVPHGRLPPEATPTAEGLRGSSLRFLKEELAQRISWSVRNFIDADDATLPRRVRLLGTDVTPAIFALAGHDAEHSLELWALPKLEALARLEAMYPDAHELALARRFFQNVEQLYAEEFDADLGRETFRLGIGFLRWVEEQARSLPATPSQAQAT